ncbi:MAG: Ig-like domain-containing protein, partial [Deltaproteobacteria bacterium]|nr:Ig-like domain-containing protein [Deltaproteobacteria bacterium]
MRTRHGDPMRKPIVLAALVLASLSCGAGKKKVLGNPEGSAIPTARSIEQALTLQANAESGLTMRLRTAASSARRGKSNAVAKGTKLTAAQTRSLLSRLPAMPAATGLKKTFAFRPASQPPPRTGKTIASRFPPPPSSLLPPVKIANKLEVVRFAPEGKVELAPRLSVTFSQPMVAVTSQAQAARTVPVELKPMPKGQWRWVGTRTLLFDPEGRMPMATRYQVHIPRSVESASGRNLGSDKDWSFETPPPTLVVKWPQGRSIGLEPVIVMVFDQAIDKRRIAQMVEVRAGSRTVGVRTATREEIEADEGARGIVASQPHGDRWVALRANKPLPRNTSVRIVVPRGTPSAEGPLKTRSAQSYSFRTYAPLQVERSTCYSRPLCIPGGQWWITMNNQLVVDSIDPGDIEITPDLPGREVRITGNSITIEGLSAARTQYTVKLPAELEDSYGQQLGKDTEVKFRVGSARPGLMGPSGLVIADPKARGTTLNVYSVGQSTLDVEIYRVGPHDWPAFADYMYKWRRKKPPRVPGKKVWGGKVKVKGSPDELVETGIDVSPALTGGLGHAVVLVQPSSWKGRWKPRIQTWVQFTKLGVDAVEDGDRLIVWANQLEDGASVAGAQVELRPQRLKATTTADGTATFQLPRATPNGRGYL